MPTPRIVRHAALLLATAALASGCGSSSAPTSASGSSYTRGLPVRTQYADFARSVNLRAGDLEGFAGAPHKAHKTSGENPRFNRCAGITKEVKPVFKAPSDDFTSRGRLEYELIRSSVEVARSVATARAEFAAVSRALGSASARACLGRALGALKGLNQTRNVHGVQLRIHISAIRIAPIALAAALAGTDGGIGLSLNARAVFVVAGNGREVTIPSGLHVDVIAFRLGRAEVTLLTETVGAPLQAELEAHLLSVLVSRAAGAGQAYPAVKR